jgi:N-methylhydantoinase B
VSHYLDMNLEQTDDGLVRCRHCGGPVGVAEQPLRDARVRESDPSEAGPAVRAHAANFTDRTIVLRQTMCPQCLVLLQAEVVPADEPGARTRSLGVRP